MPNYSGLWNGHYGQNHALRTDLSRTVQTQLLGRRREYRKAKALLNALIGATAGGTAADTYKRVSAPSGLTASEQLGGLRTIDTVTVINRATTAADVTNEKYPLNDTFRPSTYPVDPSGNGGGGKLAQGL